MKRVSIQSAEQRVGSSNGPSVIGGKYRVLAPLGEVGAGTMYRVRHTLLDSVLTLTMLSERIAAQPERLARIQDAVRRSAELRHDHIVPVLDFDQDAGRYHVVEAAIEGERLDAVLAEGPLGATDALHVARQLADALAYAHERQVVHGALSPASIILQRSNPPRAMLSGFVAARAASGCVLAYAAPERLAGREADVASDVFALGLLIFELFEGKPFFSGTPETIEDTLLRGNCPLLPQFSQIVPSGVSAVVARAIRRTPAERHANAATVRDELDACLRRLGQRCLVTKRAIITDAPVRRHGLVVDDSAEEPRIELVPRPAARPVPAAPEVREAAAARTAVSAEQVAKAERIKAALQVKPVPRGSSFPARVLALGGGMSRSVSGMPLAGKVIVAAVLLALAWPLCRPWYNLISDLFSPAQPPAKSAPKAASTPRPEPSAAPAPVAAAPAIDLDKLFDAGIDAPLESMPDPAVVSPAPFQDGGMPMPEEDGSVSMRLEKPAPARNAAPRIVSQRPRAGETVSVMEGRFVDFSVRATDKNADDRLSYAWFVDGKKLGRNASWRFVAVPGSSGTTRTIEVEVADRAGLKAPRLTWNVAITARMSEANVREWLGRLAAAWERKDIATLRLYGLVTSDAEAAAMGKHLAAEKDLRIAISNEWIRLDGGFATVGFDVTELGKDGKVLSSRRESYELEKQPNGFVGLRAR